MFQSLWKRSGTLPEALWSWHARVSITLRGDPSHCGPLAASLESWSACQASLRTGLCWLWAVSLKTCLVLTTQVFSSLKCRPHYWRPLRSASAFPSHLQCPTTRNTATYCPSARRSTYTSSLKTHGLHRSGASHCLSTCGWTLLLALSASTQL